MSNININVLLIVNLFIYCRFCFKLSSFRCITSLLVWNSLSLPVVEPSVVVEGNPDNPFGVKLRKTSVLHRLGSEEENNEVRMRGWEDEGKKNRSRQILSKTWWICNDFNSHCYQWLVSTSLWYVINHFVSFFFQKFTALLVWVLSSATTLVPHHSEQEVTSL